MLGGIICTENFGNRGHWRGQRERGNATDGYAVSVNCWQAYLPISAQMAALYFV